MKKIYSVILVFLLTAVFNCVFAQKKKGSSNNYNWGIGVRLGDPSGVSVKKYFGEKALELSLGRSHMFYRRGWYDKRFNDWYEDEKFGYDDFQYIGYGSSTPVGIQLHYLIHKDLKGIDGLQWYVGFGGQFRYQTYYFDYRYKLHHSPHWYYSTGEKVTDLDFGADGVIGLEYMFDNIPLSVFGDAVLFMEIVDNPFRFWGQGGIGVRYNF